MPKYQITPYTLRRARELGVRVVPSRLPQYKIDVYDKQGNFLTHCGATGYSDYPTYMKTHGKTYADERRRLYKIRHEKDRHKVGSRGYWASNLLW